MYQFKRIIQYKIAVCAFKWSTIWDLNPRRLLGGQKCYRYTNGAYCFEKDGV